MGSFFDRLRRLTPDQEAAARWTAHNEAARAKPCDCGKPATHVRRHYGTVGGVPYEQWGCEDHFDADGRSGGSFYWDRASPCDGCGVELFCASYGGPIDGPTSNWGCPVKSAPEDRYVGEGWVNGQ
jgi:hypothetical protein